jgi:hypothetical protein
MAALVWLKNPIQPLLLSVVRNVELLRKSANTAFGRAFCRRDHAGRPQPGFATMIAMGEHGVWVYLSSWHLDAAGFYYARPPSRVNEYRENTRRRSSSFTPSPSHESLKDLVFGVSMGPKQP